MKITSLHQQTSLERVQPESGFGDVGEGGIVAGQLGIPMVGTLGDGQVWVYDAGSGTLVPGTLGTGSLAWFNVKNYGAAGDGTTDDTAAINLAIAALIAAGRGVLYFPAGTYKCTGALTALSVPCTVLGDGMAAWDQAAPISLITCTSQTAVLFTVTATTAAFRGLALQNTYGGTPSSASRGIQQTPTTGLERVDFDSVSVRGFYNNIDIGGGTGWTMRNCWIYGPVNYGVRVRNTVNPDAGDWTISDCAIFSATYNSAAGIRIESSGGGKILGTKINKGTDSKTFTYGIDVNVATAIVTTILLVSGCSIENPSSHCFNAQTAGTGSWPYITITGCQMAPYNSTGSAVNLNAASTGKLDHAMIVGNVFATTIGSTTCAITLTNLVDVHVLIAAIEFGGGVVCSTGSMQVRDLSTLDASSGPSALIVDDGTTSPILDSGSGDYIYA